MINMLVENPLLLLFIVSAIGYLIGNLRIKSFSLGVSAILFVGIFFGSLDAGLRIPPIIVELGLIIFVYTIGLSSGRGFFASFRGGGVRYNLFVWGMLTFAALLTVGVHSVLALKPTVTSGLFSGSLTNTPSLAGTLEFLTEFVPADQLEQALAEPVVGYSVAYPMGVLGMLLGVLLMQRLFKIDYVSEAKQLRDFHVTEQELYNRTVLVKRPDVIGHPLRELRHAKQWDVVFGRMQRGDEIILATGDTVLEEGDLVSIIGTPEDVDAIVPQIGDLTDAHLEMDRSLYDFRRVFVSNPDIAGRSLAELQLPQRYGALVTRVRRGDIDLLATSSTVLELGDRVRIVSRRKDLSELSALFGDSYKKLSEVDPLSLGIGLMLGVLIGLVPIPLPGGVTFKLGFAGGPLIVGLILGALGRTGPFVWSLPYSANLTLRQMGLVLLLAGIGVNSGYTFAQTFAESGGLTLFFGGAVVTLSTGFLALLIGYRLLKIPYGLLIGMLAGLQTQPAVLGFSLEQADNELPNIGYSLVFPIATITKILYAQLLIVILS